MVVLCGRMEHFRKLARSGCRMDKFQMEIRETRPSNGSSAPLLPGVTFLGNDFPPPLLGVPLPCRTAGLAGHPVPLEGCLGYVALGDVSARLVQSSSINA